MNWMQKNRYTKELQWLRGLRLKVVLQAINGERETQQCRGELARINRLMGRLHERGRLA